MTYSLEKWAPEMNFSGGSDVSNQQQIIGKKEEKKKKKKKKKKSLWSRS